MQSPQPMQPARSTETRPFPSETRTILVGQTASQTPQKVHPSRDQRGSVTPLIPMSFSSAFMQLFEHPEIPTLNLCGTGFP